jgi:hypothetical protein
MGGAITRPNLFPRQSMFAKCVPSDSQNEDTTLGERGPRSPSSKVERRQITCHAAATAPRAETNSYYLASVFTSHIVTCQPPGRLPVAAPARSHGPAKRAEQQQQRLGSSPSTLPEAGCSAPLAAGLQTSHLVLTE